MLFVLNASYINVYTYFLACYWHRLSDDGTVWFNVPLDTLRLHF